jgi:hypothetical protein
MYIDADGFVLQPGTDDEVGGGSKAVHESYAAMVAQLPSLSGAGEALEKQFGILRSDRRPFDGVLLAFKNDHRRNADVES